MARTRRFRIEFVHPDLRAADHILDLCEAAEFAGLNLLSRYDIRLRPPMQSLEGKVYVEVTMPDSMAEKFSVRQLRGISAYLLKKYPERYREYTVGTRLLTYDNSNQKPGANPQDITMADRLEAVSRFTRLLQRNDREALEQIEQIMEILNRNNDS